jgi:hypothetical protein
MALPAPVDGAASAPAAAVRRAFAILSGWPFGSPAHESLADLSEWQLRDIGVDACRARISRRPAAADSMIWI